MAGLRSVGDEESVRSLQRGRHPHGLQPPIGDYAIIGDCRTAALVSRDGSIDWLCLPDFDCPSVFARVLDSENGGRFSVRPLRPFTTTRRYRDRTPVLETTFATEEGTILLTDVASLDEMRSLRPMREILRVVEGFSGAAEVEIWIEPRPDYGRRSVTPRPLDATAWCYGWSNEALLVQSDIRLERIGNALRGSVRALPGQRHYLSLGYTEGDIGVFPPLGRDADTRLDETEKWWRGWSEACTYAGPYREAVLRSALALKLMAFSLSGAVVAAPTTSLPESIGAGRNWDYRYCWVRDAGLTARALVGLGFHAEARGFLNWLLHATQLTWPELQVVYDVYGRTNLTENELRHWGGYRGSRPIRIGNSACAQRQLDAYGQVILAAATCYESVASADTSEAQRLAALANVVCEQWREPDHGIWEIPGEPRQYTYSKLMCWVALECLLKLHARGMISLGAQEQRFRREQAAIVALIEESGFNRQIGSYTSELDGGAVDAALLLMPSLGYKDAADPRMISTHDRIRERLGHNGLLDRYEPGYDGLEGREAAFGICGFWAVEYLALRRDIDEADRLFRHLLSFASDVGLFGEEIDPRTGAALGNFPQAFTHVGLINAALALDDARRG